MLAARRDSFTFTSSAWESTYRLAWSRSVRSGSTKKIRLRNTNSRGAIRKTIARGIVSEQNANAEPVLLTYRFQAEIDAIVDEVRAGDPLYDITTPDGIGHTVWRIADRATIARLIELFRGVKDSNRRRTSSCGLRRPVRRSLPQAESAGDGK